VHAHARAPRGRRVGVRLLPALFVAHFPSLPSSYTTDSPFVWRLDTLELIADLISSSSSSSYLQYPWCIHANPTSLLNAIATCLDFRSRPPNKNPFRPALGSAIHTFIKKSNQHPIIIFFNTRESQYQRSTLDWIRPFDLVPGELPSLVAWLPWLFHVVAVARYIHFF